MKTLSLKAILLVLFFTAFATTSCKKDKVQAPQPVIEGSWLGKYGSGNNTPNTFYSFNILPNGVLQIKAPNNGITGAGTWKLDGVNFKGVYTYSNSNETYNLAAKFDENAKTITGSWGEGDVSAGDGEFYLNKQ